MAPCTAYARRMYFWVVSRMLLSVGDAMENWIRYRQQPTAHKHEAKVGSRPVAKCQYNTLTSDAYGKFDIGALIAVVWFAFYAIFLLSFSSLAKDAKRACTRICYNREFTIIFPNKIKIKRIALQTAHVHETSDLRPVWNKKKKNISPKLVSADDEMSMAAADCERRLSQRRPEKSILFIRLCGTERQGTRTHKYPRSSLMRVSRYACGAFRTMYDNVNCHKRNRIK